MAGKRDEFRGQRETILNLNAEWVYQKWPGDFRGKSPHYICESCGFVQSRDHFEVDHVVPAARGGTAKRVTSRQSSQIQRDNIEVLHITGINSMVLCIGCNRAKGAREFVPPGSGYAFRKADIDLNPDHRYHGPPKAR